MASMHSAHTSASNALMMIIIIITIIIIVVVVTPFIAFCLFHYPFTGTKCHRHESIAQQCG